MFSKLFSTSTFPITLVLLTAISLLSYSCKKEGGSTNETSRTLHYDGEPDNAPNMPAGTYEGAARFTSSEMSNYIGDELSEIEFYIRDIPVSCEVRVYTSDGGNAPATQIYTSGNIVNSISGNNWNRQVLPTPYIIENKDLWVSIRFVHNDFQRTLGCDTGPADPNGDWTYDSNAPDWIPLVQRTGGIININWNIRAVVEFK